MTPIQRWIHRHTHIAKTYRIGNTVVRSNALGFAAKGGAAPGFSILETLRKYLIYLVEPRGIEPLTSAVRLQRSPI